jgi:hypothetical protein
MSPTSSLPESFQRAALEAVGFVGWQTWDQLRADDLAHVSGGPAVYVVYRGDLGDPEFLTRNPGGRFKGQDPTVAVDVLQAKWVPGAEVVYIGKADDAGRRLKQFARFGAGEPVGHWGGRYIWQLADSGELLVGWHAISWEETARDYEKRLLTRFSELHRGARPFANLAG